MQSDATTELENQLKKLQGVQGKIRQLLDDTDKREEMIQQELTRAGEHVNGIGEMGSRTASRFQSLGKPKKFFRGDDFVIFCQRFVDFVELNQLKSTNLYKALLQLVDDETYLRLKTVQLDSTEKANAELLCEKYKEEIYGKDCVLRKMVLLHCKQDPEETVDDYAFRLKQKALQAYSSRSKAEDNCLLAFLVGLRDQSLKRKLNEASLATFKDACVLARRIDNAQKMMDADTGRQNEGNSIQEPAGDGNQEVRSQETHRETERRSLIRRKLVKCWSCGQVGHKSFSCGSSSSNLNNMNRFRGETNNLETRPNSLN